MLVVLGKDILVKTSVSQDLREHISCVRTQLEALQVNEETGPHRHQCVNPLTLDFSDSTTSEVRWTAGNHKKKPSKEGGNKSFSHSLLSDGTTIQKQERKAPCN